MTSTVELAAVPSKIWSGTCPDWLIRDVEVFAIPATGFGFQSQGVGSAAQQELRFEGCHVWRGDGATFTPSARSGTVTQPEAPSP